MPDTVTMYVCGPTVYNLAHIGNARPVVVFDTLFRLLQTHFDTVTYARNITDVDDKIIAAAKEGQRSIESVTDEFTAKYREDMAQLNALPPTLEPHATHNIEAMLALTAHPDRERAMPTSPRACAVRRGVHAGLRQAVAALAGRYAGRRAGGSGRLQAPSRGFRAVETRGGR